LWTGVQVPAAAFRPRLSVLPYLLPGSNSANRTLRTGLDARYTLTPELTLVGSINPDFSTIERSVEGIAFTRGERYVSDRRPFFLEGRDYFESGTRFNDIGAFFYPNRIQSFDVGTKMYGKITPRDTLGLLQTSDFGRRIDTIARYRHDLSATAQVGLFLSQTSSREDNNTVVMADQRSRWGKFSLESQWSISMGRDAGGGTKVASFVYEDKRNFTLLQYQDLHERFRNANGFFPFTGYRGVFGGHAWFGEWRRGPIQNYFMVLFGFNSWHTDGRPFMRGSFFEAGMTTRSDMNIGLSARHNKFDDQTDATVGLRFTNGASNRFRRYGVYVETGKQGDRAYTFLGPDISLRVLRRLDLFYGGSFVHLDGSRQQHILSLSYEISPTRSFGGRLVTQNGGTNWYLSYRHSGEKGTEVYLILGDPNASRFTEQALVKIVFVL
jgi:hypothetical protein